MVFKNITERLADKTNSHKDNNEEVINNSNTAAHYAPIPISRMDVYTYNDILIYQRIIKPEKIKKMVGDWKPQSVGTPEVSFRNGVYWLIDGNHRRVAATQLGFTHLDCKVHTGLTIDEEARMFVTMNGERTAPTIGDLFKAKLAYHDASAVALKATIENECGLQLKLTGKSTETGIPLTSTLFKLWQNAGPDEFKQTIKTIKAMWLGYPKVWNSGFIIGVNHFLYVHHEISFKEFDKKLCGTLPAVIIGRATGGNMNSQTIYRVLVDYYNIKRRSGRLEYRDMVRKPIVDDSQTNNEESATQ